MGDPELFSAAWPSIGKRGRGISDRQVQIAPRRHGYATIEGSFETPLADHCDHLIVEILIG
jgi:hypothetical protein